ncbi:MAG: hypothetical protein UF228_01590, partial [Lachnospiraceae bacterium]|nr:hypothetical protein [Lachnospiraceae bacterium]
LLVLSIKLSMVHWRTSAMETRMFIPGFKVRPLRIALIVSSEILASAASSLMVKPRSFIKNFSLSARLY